MRLNEQQSRSRAPSKSASGRRQLPLLAALAWVVMPLTAAEPESLDPVAMAAGFHTVQSMCFSCHSPDPSAAGGIAPSMAEVRSSYLADFSNLSAFTRALVDFVDNPAAENARIAGAVERFGLMPLMSFDTDVLEDVAHYLYHTPLDQPSWYAEAYTEEQQRYSAQVAGPVTPEEYRRHGQQLAMQTKTVLGSNLKKALSESGPEGAVSFCKVRANPIAEEMSAQLGAAIKRVSDRPRNPANAATAEELAVIRDFQAAIARGEAPGSVIHEGEQHMVGYYPVITNGMCLQCHGAVGKHITASTHQVIRQAYPDDRATDYGTDELRGIFVVTMGKPSSEER